MLGFAIFFFVQLHDFRIPTSWSADPELCGLKLASLYHVPYMVKRLDSDIVKYGRLELLPLKT